LDALCKSYKRNRKTEIEKKEEQKKIEKGLGNPSAQKRKEIRGPFKLTEPVPLSPSHLADRRTPPVSFAFNTAVSSHWKPRR
jgi:hypothetical protein